jgi:hypothetical protein
MTYETTSTLPLSPLKAWRRPDVRANGAASVTRHSQIFSRLRDAFCRRQCSTPLRAHSASLPGPRAVAVPIRSRPHTARSAFAVRPVQSTAPRSGANSFACKLGLNKSKGVLGRNMPGGQAVDLLHLRELRCSLSGVRGEAGPESVSREGACQRARQIAIFAMSEVPNPRHPCLRLTGAVACYGALTI